MPIKRDVFTVLLLATLPLSAARADTQPPDGRYCNDGPERPCASEDRPAKAPASEMCMADLTLTSTVKMTNNRLKAVMESKPAPGAKKQSYVLDRGAKVKDGMVIEVSEDAVVFHQYAGAECWTVRKTLAARERQ